MNWVSEYWQDAWLREHWDATTETIEYAYGKGFITLRQYLTVTHADYLADLDRRIVADVADTLTVDEAIAVLDRR